MQVNVMVEYLVLADLAVSHAPATTWLSSIAFHLISSAYHTILSHVSSRKVSHLGGTRQYTPCAACRARSSRSSAACVSCPRHRAPTRHHLRPRSSRPPPPPYHSASAKPTLLVAWRTTCCQVGSGQNCNETRSLPPRSLIGLGAS